MSESIKYRYALDASGTVTDVNELLPGHNHEFHCAACGNILIPVLGQRRKKHFRHKTIVSCSPETYLHWIGKNIFLQEYQKCLDNNVPFNIVYHRPRVCTACQNFAPCNVGEVFETYDLTKYYNCILMERKDGAFIPDLLLKNENGKRLYVEIAVTHCSDDAKRNSNTPIIELSISCEEDLTLISEHYLHENNERVQFINFKAKPKQGNFSEECSKCVHIFQLNPSGRSRMFSESGIKYQSLQRLPASYYELVHSSNLDAYVKALEKAYYARRRVKNCYLCRYHACDHNSLRLICKCRKPVTNSNDAADCGYYRADPGVFEFDKRKIGKSPKSFLQLPRFTRTS